MIMKNHDKTHTIILIISEFWFCKFCIKSFAKHNIEKYLAAKNWPVLLDFPLPPPSINRPGSIFCVHEKSEYNKIKLFFFLQELAAIQGCSKKKVEILLKMRPFEGWGDLVSKVQSSKQLSTEILNNSVMLLKMRDAVARLMEKCEKITDKMARMVEGLTSEESNKELTEQPKSIPDGLKMTGYQMIGLNWLVLMHKQSLNGILADEMVRKRHTVG